MARLATSGFEIGAAATDSKQSPDGQQSLGAGSTFTRDTSVKRSGLASAKMTSTGAGIAFMGFISSAVATSIPLGTTAYQRVYVSLSGLPSSAFSVIRFLVVGSAIYDAKINTDGTIGLFVNVTTQIGSWSAQTVATDSGVTWTRIELSQLLAAGAGDAAELRVDGTTIASESGASRSDGTTANFNVGFATAPGNAISCWLDDFAVNDSTGADQNSWPGAGSVAFLFPVSLNANGGSWTDDAAATTSAALTAAVDNTPPNGIADTTAGGGNHQIRNAAANTSIDFNLTDYTTAGVTGTVNVLTPVVNVGAPVSTGAKSGSFGVLSNPTIGQRAFTGGSGTVTFFWRGAAAGTWPSNWGWENGTTTYTPTVTLGTQPVARLLITGGTTSRIAMCDFLGVYVDYTPAATTLPPLPVYVDSAVARSTSY